MLIIMQTSRLFKILNTLVEGGGTTAGALAAALEVSVRTIYRDVEQLAAAGIPIYCAKGKGGGIRLLPGYVLDRQLLSGSEQQEVLSALQALAVAGGNSGQALQKLGALFRQDSAAWVEVDFAGWGGGNRRAFEIIKTAVLEKQRLCFDYFGGNGQKSRREAEPLQLYFRHRAWYLRAWCICKDAPRMFKLSRMRNVEATGQQFQRRLDLAQFEASNTPGPSGVDAVLEFDASMAYRVYDEFDERDIQVLPVGGFRVTARLYPDEWLMGNILSYGPMARVVSPAFLREEICRRIEKMLENY